MKKLSNAQQKVYDQILHKVKQARSMEYPEWLVETEHYFQVPKWMDDPEAIERIKKRLEEAISRKYLKKYYDDAIRGVVLTSCNSKTLEKLQEFGLIEIIYDSKGEHCTGAIDTVKLVEV